MQAFHDIRTEMRDSCLALTRPFEADRPSPIVRVNRSAAEDKHGLGDHIEPWMEEAFEDLIRASGTGAPFALVPCFMNGKPATVIALARPAGRAIHIMPLFLACQPWMRFSGAPREGGEDAGASAGDDPPMPA